MNKILKKKTSVSHQKIFLKKERKKEKANLRKVEGFVLGVLFFFFFA